MTDTMDSSDCRRYRRAIHAWHDGESPDSGCRAHLEVCERCRTLLRELGGVDDVLVRLAEPPPPELFSLVTARVRAQRQPRTGSRRLPVWAGTSARRPSVAPGLAIFAMVVIGGVFPWAAMQEWVTRTLDLLPAAPMPVELVSGWLQGWLEPATSLLGAALMSVVSWSSELPDVSSLMAAAPPASDLFVVFLMVGGLLCLGPVRPYRPEPRRRMI